ncbi:MAG: DNA polymerase III subunit chi [Pseudomonadota bacterium]
MGEVHFYHLTRNPLEPTLATLLGKCLDRGWRVAVRGTDAERLKHLDEALWLGPKDGFLPHGVSGGPHDARQPILLTEGTATNTAQVVMSVDGAELSAEEITALERACILFDGQNGEAVAHARGQWTALTGAGLPARYWSEETGRWTEKASKNL